MAGSYTSRLGDFVADHESIPQGAAVAPLTPPPFDEDALIRVTTEPPPDGCPAVAPRTVVHLHMTASDIRAGLCALVLYLPGARTSDRVAFVERCFRLAPTVKRMSGAARIAYAVVSLRLALDAIGASRAATDRLIERIYDVIDPRAISGWEGALMAELPESATDLVEMVGATRVPDWRVECAFVILEAAFGIAREVDLWDMWDSFGIGELIIIPWRLEVLGLTPVNTEPFLRFPVAASRAGAEELAHLRHVIASSAEGGYRG